MQYIPFKMHFLYQEKGIVGHSRLWHSEQGGWLDKHLWVCHVCSDCPGYRQGTHSPLEARALGSVATRWQQLDEGMSRRTGAPPQTEPGKERQGANIFQK